MDLHVVLLAATAAASSPRPAVPVAPPTNVDIKAEGVTLTGTVVTSEKDRFRMVATEKGTILIAVESIHGPAPNVRLVNAEGKTLRRGVRGKTFARPNPGDELTLEIATPYKEAASTYHLTVAFDVDRPRAQRHLPRALRPRDIVRVSTEGATDLEQVTVGGLGADYAINGGDVLITIPAYAQHGTIELRFESRPPIVKTVELIGCEQDVADRTGACAGTGCVAVIIAPHVGPRWLEAIAKLLDADVTRHIVATGAVTLKLRLPSSESYALEQLRRMPAVSSVQACRDGPCG